MSTTNREQFGLLIIADLKEAARREMLEMMTPDRMDRTKEDLVKELEYLTSSLEASRSRESALERNISSASSYLGRR